MRTENTGQSYFIPKARNLTEIAHPANPLGHNSRQIQNNGERIDVFEEIK